ncbi:c-type cytochrome [Flavihumibacter petaseus]|uniref:Cytochrome c domain-containing protein n=1 Tax=Flavihumibacter petaseus NBRC 106054 TaxID=1220578 RepID=A0A0E9N247_9BACT|nr:hypothetical protein [Flavihumibacter petaseus]GAO43899.1 hypothetical protein FPE01S_02_10050 [Flavihumibacter petaseus NBRC 106054]
MKAQHILLASQLIALCLLSSCSKDKESDQPTDPDNPPTCNTANMSFANNVLPIINSNCSSCHGATPTAPFSLTNYAEVKVVADDGRLIGAINHQSGYVPMPQNAAKLSSCNIAKIQAWIDQGKPNN